MEIGTKARLAFYADASFHQLNQSGANGKPQSYAAKLSGRRRVNLFEQLEDIRGPILRNTDPGICYDDMQHDESIFHRINEDLHVNKSGLRKLKSIGQQIGDNLSKLSRISKKPDRRVGSKRPVQTDLLFQGSLTKLRNNFHKQIVQIKSGVIQPSDSVSNSLAGRTLSEIEKMAILQTLRHVRGNKAKAARELGISEKSIYNKLKRLGIDY